MHGHLGKIDYLKAHTACLLCFISTGNGCNKNKIKEAKNALENVALVAGTLQNLSNLYSLDIYGWEPTWLCQSAPLTPDSQRLDSDMDRL